jgi:hypothetical protein
MQKIIRKGPIRERRFCYDKRKRSIRFQVQKKELPPFSYKTFSNILSRFLQIFDFTISQMCQYVKNGTQILVLLQNRKYAGWWIHKNVDRKHTSAISTYCTSATYVNRYSPANTSRMCMYCAHQLAELWYIQVRNLSLNRATFRAGFFGQNSSIKWLSSYS